MPKHLWFAVAAGVFFAASVALQAANPQVLLKTSKGDITIELFQDKAPVSAKNFLAYVDSKYYDGLIFHRVIKGFMVQGGGMDKNMKEKGTDAPIQNEADNGLKNKAYTVAMARTGDPHSATSQFFINAKYNDFLDFKSQTPQGWGYAVFGKVIKGQEVVDKIAAVQTGKKGYYDDVPMETVIIKKAEIVE